MRPVGWVNGSAVCQIGIGGQSEQLLLGSRPATLCCQNQTAQGSLNIRFAGNTGGLTNRQH